MTVAVAQSHGELVDAQLAAYNDQDLEAFCAFYSDDATLGGYGDEPHTRGLAAIRERHAKLFAEFPQNRAVRTNRIVVGNVVIDHEDVVRGPGVEPFQVAAIYTLSDGKIVRVDFVK